MSEPMQTERPTRVRHTVVGLATLMAVFLYLDRFCLSIAERYIKEDLDLSNRQVGWLLSAFFLTYALAQVPGGWLSDRFGARLMLSVYILLWSLLTGFMGLAQSLLAIVVFRLGCGLAQAGAFPTCGGLLSRWVPLTARGLASSIVAAGGRVGGFTAPILTAILIVSFVPADAPAKLWPDDLLDVAKWCKSLRKHEDKPELELGRMILATFPADAGELVRSCQGTPDAKITPEERTVLASAFNRILERKDLYSWVDLSQFDLPGEARRLASKKDEDLSAYETLRRNRLLLEAAFPELIRKLYGLGWRPVMLIYGAAGLFIALLFWVLVRDRPRDHPLCDAAERALISAGQPLEVSLARQTVEALPIKHILRHRSLWLGSITQFGTNVGWVFLLTWLPRYLDEVHHVPVVERGLMTSLPTLLGMAGMVTGGWLTDYLTRRLGLRWGRCLPMALTRFVAMAAFLVCIQLRSPWPATAAFCVVAIATDLGTPAMWAFAQDIGGRNVGSVLGWGNMWGNLGATVSPLLLNWVVEETNWTVGFLVCAGAFLVAGVAALGIDARQPIVPPQSERPAASPLSTCTQGERGA